MAVNSSDNHYIHAVLTVANHLKTLAKTSRPGITHSMHLVAANCRHRCLRTNHRSAAEAVHDSFGRIAAMSSLIRRMPCINAFQFLSPLSLHGSMFIQSSSRHVPATGSIRQLQTGKGRV
ncbi:hypothetical protein M3J09_007774 [Ascochyta lentis]